MRAASLEWQAALKRAVAMAEYDETEAALARALGTGPGDVVIASGAVQVARDVEPGLVARLAPDEYQRLAEVFRDAALRNLGDSEDATGLRLDSAGVRAALVAVSAELSRMNATGAVSPAATALLAACNCMPKTLP